MSLDEAAIAQLKALQQKHGAPARRFTDKPELDPESVRELAADHPAMRENRTLFPSTVVEVTNDAPDRLLVSGRNNRKFGDVVVKGRLKGYALYGLSLEERATCPDDCKVRSICYGNSMHLARRHRIKDLDVFFDRLGLEILDLLVEHPGGLLVRLHVLGDFPSVEYVERWAELIEEHESLAVYGYTARRVGDKIGDAIANVKRRFPSRFRIRWSNSTSRADSALVIDHVPDAPKYGDAVVCPAQTDATACCASCGLCWESMASPMTIAFIKHGPKAEREPEPAPTENGLRKVRPVSVPGRKQAAPVSPAPTMRLVNPTNLLIESAYQRDLSKRSLALIRKIANGWDWAKFKPPICAERGDDLVIIDGQHTAMAAATLPITEMPVMIVCAEELEERADAFVAHNRDRLAMSHFQIFHASVVAGDPAATAIMQLATATGVTIPRSLPPKGQAKPGQVVAIVEIMRCYKTDGPDVLQRIFRIAAGAQSAPLGRAAARALRTILTEGYFADVARMPDSRIANAVRSIERLGTFDDVARSHANETDQPTARAGAVLIQEACTLPKEVA